MAWREAVVDTRGAVRPNGAALLADRPAPCGLRAGPRSGAGADAKGQPPPRIRFAASVRFFTPSAL